jgi:hypothetical protein
MGEGRNVFRVLVGKPEGKRPLEDQGIDRRMGSKLTLGRFAEGGRKWIPVPQDRDCQWAVMNVVMNLWVLAPWS